MTISNETTFTGPLIANGITTAFPFTFLAMGEDEIEAYAFGAAGSEASLPDFTVTLSGAAPAAGTITFESPPADGTRIWIVSAPDFRQEIAFEDGSRWLAGPVNEANDRAAIRSLALRRDADRAVKLPIGEAGVTLPAGSGPTLYASVNRLAGIAEDIETVADRAADVATVANRDADIGIAAARDAAIGVVAARDADIGTVAERDLDIGALALRASDLTALGPVAAEIETCADNIAGILAAHQAAIDADVAADRAEAAEAATTGIVSGMAGAIALAQTVKPKGSVLAEWTAAGGLDANAEGAPLVAQLTTEYLMVNDQYLHFDLLFGLVDRFPAISGITDRISFGQATSPLTVLGAGRLDPDGDGYPVVSTSGDDGAAPVLANPISTEGREVSGGAYSFPDAATTLMVIPGLGMSNMAGHASPDTLTDVSAEYAGIKMLGSTCYDNTGAASPIGWPATWAAGDTTAWGSSILPAEYTFINGDTSNGMISMANMLTKHASYHLGFNVETTGLNVLIGDTATTGQKLADILSGTNWTKTTNFLNYAASAATTLGFAGARVPAVFLDDGGRDTTDGTDPVAYYNSAITIPALMQAAQSSALGINAPVCCGVEQQALNAQYGVISSAAERAAWLIECAQGLLARRPDMFITGVGFSEPYDSGFRHMLVLGQERKRARSGIKLAQLLVTGRLPVHPFIQTIRWTAKGATITFAGGVGEIAPDTDSIYNPTGFNLGAAFHSSSDIPIVITHYEQVATNSWHFETESLLTSGTRFSLGRCALPNGVLGYPTANSAGPITGPRHCFRDQAGEHPLNQVLINGVTHKLHNWVIRGEFIR